MSRARAGYDLKRDRPVLDHVARFRLTTLRVVCRLFLPGRTPSTAKEVLNRLGRRQLLRSYRMTQQGVECYQLTSAGAYRAARTEGGDAWRAFPTLVDRERDRLRRVADFLSPGGRDEGCERRTPQAIKWNCSGVGCPAGRPSASTPDKVRTTCQCEYAAGS